MAQEGEGEEGEDVVFGGGDVVGGVGVGDGGGDVEEVGLGGPLHREGDYIMDLMDMWVIEGGVFVRGKEGG